MEINHHTPSNCDVCNKTLSWSLLGVGEGSYECKREFGRLNWECWVGMAGGLVIRWVSSLLQVATSNATRSMLTAKIQQCNPVLEVRDK